MGVSANLWCRMTKWKFLSQINNITSQFYCCVCRLSVIHIRNFGLRFSFSCQRMANKPGHNIMFNECTLSAIGKSSNKYTKWTVTYTRSDENATLENYERINGIIQHNLWHSNGFFQIISYVKLEAHPPPHTTHNDARFNDEKIPIASKLNQIERMPLIWVMEMIVSITNTLFNNIWYETCATCAQVLNL